MNWLMILGIVLMSFGCGGLFATFTTCRKYAEACQKQAKYIYELETEDCYRQKALQDIRLEALAMYKTLEPTLSKIGFPLIPLDLENNLILVQDVLKDIIDKAAFDG